MTRQDSDPEKLAATHPDSLADTQEPSQSAVRQCLCASVTKSQGGVLSVKSSVSLSSPEAKRAKRAEAEDKPSATATAFTADMVTQEQHIANMLEAMAILPGIAAQVRKQNEVLADMQKNMSNAMRSF